MIDGARSRALRFDKVLSSDGAIVLAHINGCVWGTVRARNAHICAMCRAGIKPKEEALAPLTEAARRGVVRYMRVCIACAQKAAEP